MEAPDALKDVQNYYNEIYEGNVAISLLTSSAKSPTGKVQLCASTCFSFNEELGKEPSFVHEMLDNNLHLMSFKKQMKAGETYRFSIIGSSVTSSHYNDSLNQAERLGETEKAYQFFKDSYEPNVFPPSRVHAKTKGGNNPYFCHWGRRCTSKCTHGFWRIGNYADGHYSIERHETTG